MTAASSAGAAPARPTPARPDRATSPITIARRRSSSAWRSRRPCSPLLPQVAPLSVLQQPQPWFDAFANAGVFVLLAMGLNVVVGLAGLLDLGYAAFFAIGAYTYAYSNSPYSHMDLPFLPMLIVGAAVAAVFGIALGAPTLRLRGDYLAIMTLGFGEIVPIVFLNLENWTEGTNGIGGIYRPEPLPGIGEFSALTPFAYFILDGGHHHDRHGRCSTGSRIRGSGEPGTPSARTSWRPRPTASTPSRPSSSRSRSARRRPAWPASSTPRS